MRSPPNRSSSKGSVGPGSVAAVTGPGGESEGWKLFGESTYLELMVEVDVPGIDVATGDCAIASNAERGGSVAWIADEMERRHPESDPSTGLRHLQRGERSVPWYGSVSFSYPEGRQGIGVWALELHGGIQARHEPRSFAGAGGPRA